MPTTSCVPPVVALPVLDPAFVVGDLQVHEGVLEVALRGAADGACCPDCGVAATRVHSVYGRTLADLAAQDLPVRLVVKVRRFRCVEPSCKRTTFVEGLGSLARARARRTTRLASAMTRVGLALGGEAAARLLPVFGAPTSADTVLRLVRCAPRAETPTPRVLGVDDWAWRRGNTYGTVLVDLERRVPVDVLPDRTAATFAQGLADHPDVEIVSRDRAESYAEGARIGAPEAQQIADRWHLLKNIGDLLERILHHDRAVLVQAAVAVTLSQAPATPKVEEATSPMVTREAALRARRRAAAQARYEQIHSMHAAGRSIHSIAAELDLSRPTVRKNLRAASCPTRAPPAHEGGHADRIRHVPSRALASRLSRRHGASGAS